MSVIVKTSIVAVATLLRRCAESESDYLDSCHGKGTRLPIISHSFLVLSRFGGQVFPFRGLTATEQEQTPSAVASHKGGLGLSCFC